MAHISQWGSYALLPRSEYGDIHDCDTRTLVWRKDAGSTEGLWHSGDKHIARFQISTSKLLGLCRCKSSVRLITELSDAYISKLDQPHFAVLILILGLDPVAISE